MNENKSQDEMTLVEHLTELRDRIINSAWYIMGATTISWYFSDKIFDFVRAPIQPYLPSGGLVFTAPTDKFMAHLKLSIWVGILMSCPFWLYQTWQFIAPGLYKNEKKYATSFIGFGSLLFLLGTSFAYFLVYPAAFKYLLTFGGTQDQAMITIDGYLSFFITTALVFGIAFELPLIVVILGLAGVVTKELLIAMRRYAIVFLAVVAAVVTPPDLLSMLMLLIPLVLLYEISIHIVGFFEKKS